LNSNPPVHNSDLTGSKKNSSARKINFCWDIFTMNESAMSDDFQLLTKGKKSLPISSTNRVINPGSIFLEEGAKVECTMLNASAGPIYIGRNAEVMEGAMIRGPFSLGEQSQLKLGSKIYGATTIGPHCRVGGEVSNSVIFGYSNKAHDGFLGNSVIGEWCNLGADSNNSNLKNNYSQVKMWNYREENYINTGLTFCGLMMGDHSKCSINTMFNTGTVVGVSANIFGTGFPPKFIPSFSWGGSDGFKTYRLEEAVEVASRVYERRGMKLADAEQKILKYLFDATTKFRSW
jgi:UDP-N-acetylglucosamine diphosphorylase/glucosamine-1-phosphate N-acetyltransferase